MSGCDVWGLDPALLQMVPRPCWALCLLYPCAKVNKARREVFSDDSRYESNPGDVFYMKQHDRSGNACGTIALIHSVANAPSAVAFSDDSVLGSFIRENRGKAPDAVGDALCNAQNIQEASDTEAHWGETTTPARVERVDHHFICLSRCLRGNEWHLCELDGRLNGIVDHGAVTEDSFLEAAARVVREEYMAMDTDSISFNVVALCGAHSS